MASATIHMAVANEVNKVLKRDNNIILLGSIAPDISKHVGQTKLESHFLDNVENDIPNMDKFLEKYKNNLDDDFVMGYFIHLYTDYLWFKYFMPEFFDKDMITKKDGTKVKCIDNMLSIYIYNDYTNLNISLMDEYNLDLNIFYEDIPPIKDIIKEIPMDKMQLIIDKTGILIKNSKEEKELIFDITNIKTFVKTSTELTLAKIKEVLGD